MVVEQLDLKGFSKNYKSVEILNNIHLEFKENKVNFILGKNGAGKTTLFKCILGLEDYCGGIFYKNINLNTKNKVKVFCIFDDTPFYKNISGKDNVQLFLSMYNIKNKNIEQNLLNEDILKRKVSTYSYGQRKKLSLIIAKIINPDILLLDEVSNGLDYETIIYLKKEIMALKNGRVLILTGHQLDFYNEIVDDIFVMKDNNIIKVEEKENLGDIYERYII